MVAIVHELDSDGTPVIAGRIRLVNGALVPDPPENETLEYILSTACVRRDTGAVVHLEDGAETFLRALPAAYTGTYLRVALEE